MLYYNIVLLNSIVINKVDQPYGIILVLGSNFII
jgi:hypothetical protein